MAREITDDELDDIDQLLDHPDQLVQLNWRDLRIMASAFNIHTQKGESKKHFVERLLKARERVHASYEDDGTRELLDAVRAVMKR